ncbi:hypothetical protein NDU88_005570, partial [Pleurodeles waltl]
KSLVDDRETIDGLVEDSNVCKTFAYAYVRKSNYVNDSLVDEGSDDHHLVDNSHPVNDHSVDRSYQVNGNSVGNRDYY